MDLLTYELQDGVAVVQLSNQVTNAINLEMVNSLAALLAQLKQEPRARSLLLTSANAKFFSIGFDIPHLYDLPQEQFRRFYQSFNRLCLDLYTFPKPTLAAICGHAIAGGCILALCCDYRFISRGHKLTGLNEIKLGVPVPYLADLILGELVGRRIARDMMELGEFYQADAALDLGLVERVLPLDQLLPAAIEMLRSLGAMPAEAFAAIKQNRVEHVVQRFENKIAEREAHFIRCWYMPETRARLLAAIDKF